VNYVKFLSWLGIKKKSIHKSNKKNGQFYTNASQQGINDLPAKLEQTIENIQSECGNSPDIIIHRFAIGKKSQIPAAIIYTDGLVNNSNIQNFLKLLLINYPEQGKQSPIFKIKEQLINIGEVKELINQTNLINELLRGSTIVLVDGYRTAIGASTKGWEARGVSEPENELVLRGPREGFTENLRTNTALIRRKIPNSKLRLEQTQIGKLTETNIAVLYIEGIANPKIVEEVRRRLAKIDIDSVLESGYIEEFIGDEPWSLFPTVYNSERPDVISSELLQGRVAIIVDGTPFVLAVPATFAMFFQAADDYYIRSYMSSLLRILRASTFLISMTLPALYVAITTFHPELLPTTLLVGLAAQREGVPFPAFVEAMLMELTFEVLREAGVRMPRAVGQAVSIVGALVLGTSAVDAGIVSAAMVIVVSMTAIASFTTPSINLAIPARIIRFGLLILGASFGLFGILFGLMVIAIHLVSLRSFGIPYLSGIAPLFIKDQKDLFIRVPWFWMKNRPELLNQTDMVREHSQVPKPPHANKRRRK